MAYRFIQFDAVTGVVRGSTDTVEMGKDGPISPEGTIIVDSKDVPEAATAARYLPETKTFEQPPPRRRPLSKFEFMSLFTAAERNDIRTRTAAGDATLADAFDMFSFAAYIDPNHALTRQMLGYIQSIGVMNAQRLAAFNAAMLAVSES